MHSVGYLIKHAVLATMIVGVSYATYEGYQVLRQMIDTQTAATYNPALVSGTDPASNELRQNLSDIQVQYQAARAKQQRSIGATSDNGGIYTP